MQQNNKNRLLVGGFLVLLFIAYQLGVSKTITLKKQLSQLEEEVQVSGTIKNSLNSLKEREQQADAVLKKNNLQNISVQNNLLTILTTASQTKDFTVSDFKEPHTYSQDGFIKTSYQFSLRGNFNDILHIAYTLEQKYNLGNISHLNFEKKTDYRKRKKYLEADFIIENFASNK